MLTAARFPLPSSPLPGFTLPLRMLPTQPRSEPWPRSHHTREDPVSRKLPGQEVETQGPTQTPLIPKPVLSPPDR